MNILFWVVVIVGVGMFLFFQNRFKHIEEYLNLLKTAFLAKKPSSYKAEITVSPNWAEIVKWYFPKLNTDKEAREFINKLLDNPKIKIDDERSLYHKSFSFVEFYDGVSGLNPIWSYHYKKFASDLEIVGWLLKDEEGILDDKFDIKNKDGGRKSDFLVISPSHIATNQEYGGETISRIPYHDIVSFFIKIYEETGSAEWQVKKFPKEIQKAFDKAKIVYEPSLDTHMGDLDPKTGLLKPKSKWIEENGVELYEQNVECHTFKTSYFEVSFRLTFFQSNDNRPWNGAFEIN